MESFKSASFGKARVIYNIYKMKVNKYDRQIRLWGARGQKKIAEARVALLGCSGAGIQALKNLVLPAVGQIDIWDSRSVTLQDLSSSFFYSPEDIGKPRAEAASVNLLEMNPDVKGEIFVRQPIDILQNEDLLRQYQLLIVGDLGLNEQKIISKVCWDLNISVVFVTVIGFYVYIRNQKKQHIVEFQKTAAKKYYLRLHDPFPALQKYASKWNIAALIEQLQQIQNEKELNHLKDHLSSIPYPVILMQARQCLPKEKQNRNGILQLIKNWSMRVGEGYRQNFTQASGRQFDLMQDADNFLRGLDRFQNRYVASANQKSSQSLIFLKACAQYLKRTGHLPQPIDLPDMQTETKIYLDLKDAYKEEHRKSINGIESIIIQTYGKVILSQEAISEYINHIEALQVIQFTPYYQQLERIENPTLQWLDPQWRHILLAIRAHQIFQESTGNFPKMQDFQSVKTLANQIKEQFGFKDLSEDRYLNQICRIDNQTTISINSIAGAIAGQQAVKMISNCFLPVKDGYLFSGVHSCGFPVQLLP